MKPIVVKVGTGVLTNPASGTLDGSSLVRLVSGLADFISQGQQVILVSSGAVGAGVATLQLTHYPEKISTRQAAAALGQVRLMQAYQNLFSHFDLNVAQLLLSSSDLDASIDPNRPQNITTTLQELLSQPRIIPIINENDTVATEELKIGDNDLLSARLASMIQAQRLILLTTVDGLLPPNSPEIIPNVHNIDEILHFAKDEKGPFSIGGMSSKLQAVKYALQHQIPTQIANGNKSDRLNDLFNQDLPSTYFHPQTV